MLRVTAPTNSVKERGKYLWLNAKLKEPNYKEKFFRSEKRCSYNSAWVNYYTTANKYKALYDK